MGGDGGEAEAEAGTAAAAGGEAAEAAEAAEASPFASSYHAPVMWREVLEHLVTDPQGSYLDCTLGGGGHSAAILSRLDAGGPGKVVALDQDPDALAFATRRLADAAAAGRFRALRANFRSARAVVEAEGCMPPGGFTGAWRVCMRVECLCFLERIGGLRRMDGSIGWIMSISLYVSHISTPRQACCWTWASPPTSSTRPRGYVRACIQTSLGRSLATSTPAADPITAAHPNTPNHAHTNTQQGFSFRGDGPLDMRMQGGKGGGDGGAVDPDAPDTAVAAALALGGLTAADIVNTWEVGALSKVLKEYGEEPRAYKLARAMVAARPLESTAALRAVVEQHTAYADRPKTLARVFQVRFFWGCDVVYVCVDN